jgi:hypothetical protein
MLSDLPASKDASACKQFVQNAVWHASTFLKVGPERFILLCALVGMIFIGTTDSVLYVRLSLKMEGYEWFLSQVAMTVAFCLISWPVTWYKMYVSKSITPEIRNGVSMRVYMMIGMLDAMANMLGTIPLPYIPGPVVSVLGKIGIPLLMGGSVLFLKTRYKITHFLGAAVIIVGVVVNLVPFITESGDDMKMNHWFWSVLILISAVPGVSSSLYKEKYLKGAPTNVWLFNSWVAIFQLGWGLAMAWFVFIPMPSPSAHIRFSEFPGYLLDSIACFMGLNTAEPICRDTLAVFVVFILFNVIMNVLVLFVFKKGSAVLATIVGTSTMILTNLAYHVPFVAGEASQTGISGYNLRALGIIVLGIVMYNIKSEEKKETENDIEDLMRVVNLGEEDGESGIGEDDVDKKLFSSQGRIYAIVDSSEEEAYTTFSPYDERSKDPVENTTEMKTIRKKTDKLV